MPEPAYELGEAGRAWWTWAWSLPQAAAWDDGASYALTRRAQLEDTVAALGFDDWLALDDLLAGADPEAIQRVRWALDTLKRSAAGKLSIDKEMRELDRRFGLDPKAMAELRWTIVAKADDRASPMTPGPKPSAGSNVRRLRAVDPQAAAG